MIAYGTIEEIVGSNSVKDYHMLSVLVDIPFKTEVLKFHGWSTNLLHKNESGELFQKGDGVQLEYHCEDNRLCLDKMDIAKIDNCPVCYSTVPATDTQRIDCNGCQDLPLHLHKIRIDKVMTLLSLKVKDYLYSSGYRLELQARDEQTSSYGVVFPNKRLIYSLASNLKVGQSYHIQGWKSGHLLDINEINTLN